MGRKQRQHVERIDERDTMFARAERSVGTRQYEEYYELHPELRSVDDRIRVLPPLLDPAGRYYDLEVVEETARYFREIEHIEIDHEVVDTWRERIEAEDTPWSALKTMARVLGAVNSGCTLVAEEYFYSHKGRLDADFGRPVQTDLSSAIVFLVEMEHGSMQNAPQAQVLLESARQYYRAAVIAKTIEAALLAVGHRARAHFDGHYDVILPPLAVEAGLGELGRNNILVADHYGSRVRIGAVTTDLSLEPDDADAPRSLGVARFCERCKKCADNCPKGSLTKGSPETIRGAVKWPTRIETCYSYWRRIGTDCGICMAVCPFSHKHNWFHDFVRWLVRVHPLLSRAMLYGDELVYGRKWTTREKK